MNQKDCQKLQRYLDQSQTQLEEQLILYALAERSLADVWRKIASLLRQRLCHKWKSCSNHLISLKHIRIL